MGQYYFGDKIFFYQKSPSLYVTKVGLSIILLGRIFCGWIFFEIPTCGALLTIKT